MADNKMKPGTGLKSGLRRAPRQNVKVVGTALNPKTGKMEMEKSTKN